MIYMTFRKNALLFYQSTICYIVFLLLCAALIPAVGLFLSVLCSLPFVVLLSINPKLHNEFITIDETGISCKRAKAQSWEYSWDNIAFLKTSSRFLMPSIEVIPYDQFGKPELFSLPNHYFQLSRSAKKAMRQYPPFQKREKCSKC